MILKWTRLAALASTCLVFQACAMELDDTDRFSVEAYQQALEELGEEVPYEDEIAVLPDGDVIGDDGDIQAKTYCGAWYTGRLGSRERRCQEWAGVPFLPGAQYTEYERPRLY